MGWVEGVVTVVGSLAWPIVVLVSVLALRREIGKLITRLTRFSGAGVEAEFQQEVETASDLAEAISPDAPEEFTAGSEGKPTLKELVRVASANPLLAVLTTWRLVSAAISDLGEDLGFKVITERGAMRELRTLGIVSDEVVALAERLTKIRNEVVHQRPTVTADEAQDFVVAAWRLAAELRRTRADHAALHSRGKFPPDEV